MARSNHLVAWHRKALEAEVPISAYLELTHTCNLSCVFCCNRKVEDRAPLALGEWRRVISELRSLGSLYVTLTGGEPLAHPDFFEIASSVREEHMAIRLLTNGTLIDEHRADRIAALHPLSVELSVHGATAATHDGATGVVGSFDLVWSAIERLRRRAMTVVLKTPVTALNAEEIGPLTDLCATRGLPLRLDPELTARDDGDRAPLEYEVRGDAHVRLHEMIGQRELSPVVERHPGGPNCGLGRSTLAIGPDGEVYPCVLWRSSSYGNIREAPLRTLWNLPERSEMAVRSDRANEQILALGKPWSSNPTCPARTQIPDGVHEDPCFSPKTRQGEPPGTRENKHRLYVET